MRIAGFQFVTQFEFDDSIILTSGPNLKKIAEKFKGRLATINAPQNAPPDLPRILLKFEDTIFNISFDRFNISTTPPAHVANDFDKAAKFTIQRISSLIKDLIPFISKFNWTGVIADIIFPEDPIVSKSTFEAANPIFDRLINIDRNNRELGAFNLNFGIKSDQYFINYTITAFETRKIKIPSSNRKKFININLSEQPLSERGIKILLDINNKPSIGFGDPIEDVENIFSIQKKQFKNLINDLNLEGIINDQFGNGTK